MFAATVLGWGVDTVMIRFWRCRVRDRFRVWVSRVFLELIGPLAWIFFFFFFFLGGGGGGVTAFIADELGLFFSFFFLLLLCKESGQVINCVIKIPNPALILTM